MRQSYRPTIWQTAPRRAGKAVLVAMLGGLDSLTEHRNDPSGRKILATHAAWFGALFGLGFADAAWAVWVTGALIVLHACVLFEDVIKRKWVNRRSLLFLTALFFVAPYQIACAYGAGHYSWAHDPGPWSWAQFTLAHLLRAVDVIDCLEVYRFDAQHVRHASTLSGCWVVALHLTAGLFALGLVTKWARNTLLKESGPARGSRPAARVTAVVVCVLLAGAWAWANRWGAADWVLWPLDQVVRTLDFADVMQTFRVRLHDVPPDPWTPTLGLAFRAAVGLYVARAVGRRLMRSRLGAISAKSAEELIDDIRTGDAEVRAWAERQLDQYVGHRAVPALLGLAADPEPALRATGVRILGRQSPHLHATVLDAVTAAARDPDAGVRLAAATALGRAMQSLSYQSSVSENPAGVCVAALGELLRDPDGATRAAAAGGLMEFRGEFGTRLTQELGRLADDPDPSARLAAAGALARDPDFRAWAVPVLCDGIRSEDPVRRRIARTAFGYLGPDAGTAVAALTVSLSDPSAEVSLSVMSALASVGASSAPATPELVALARGQDVRLRAHATYALSAIGPASPEGFAALLGLMGDPVGEVRQMTPQHLREWLFRSGPGTTAAAIPGIVALLGDPVADVRRITAYQVFAALSRRAAECPGAPPFENETLKAALAKGAGDRDKFVAKNCLEAKQLIGDTRPESARVPGH